MEKRNYLKPVTEFHAINSTPFMTTSNLIIDADPDNTEAAVMLDNCVRFQGDLVDNSTVINFLMGKDNYTACFKIQRWENSDKDQKDICTDDKFINGHYVQVTYDVTNKKFIFNFNSGCSTDDGVGGGGLN